ncbi:MAG: flippase [Candidatus Kerfeldbacteria bacterium]|nr:flippase [Candidatus Kerfeldbacteria bacterium]
MSESRLARNTTYLTVASLMQKVISLWYFAYLSNSLGTENTGKYAYALTFTSVFSLFMDFGIGQVLTREGAKDPDHLQEHVDRVIGLKIMLMMVAWIVMFGTILGANIIFQNVTAEDVLLVAVASIAMTIDTVTSLCWSVFRAKKQLLYEAISTFVYQIAVVVSGVILLKIDAPLPLLIGALSVGSLLQSIGMLTLVFKKARIRFRIRFNKKDAQTIFLISWPFAVANLCNRLYGSVDQQLLKVTVSNTHAAWYAIAYKSVFALTVIPGSFATSYYPVMSEYLKHNTQAAGKTFSNALVYMLLLSIPISFGVLVLGEDIILAVWDTVWGTAAQPLRVLMYALPFVFLNYPIGNLLNAAGLQRTNTRNMIIALMINVVLNFVLIPYFSYMGAAYAFLTSSIVLVIIGFPTAYRIAPFAYGIVLKKAAIFLLSGAIMAGILFAIQHSYNLLSLIGISAVVYGALVFLLRGIALSDIRAILSRKM